MVTWALVILVAVVLLVVLYVWRHIRNDRKARAELVDSEVARQPTSPSMSIVEQDTRRRQFRRP